MCVVNFKTGQMGANNSYQAGTSSSQVKQFQQNSFNNLADKICNDLWFYIIRFK